MSAATRFGGGGGGATPRSALLDDARLLAGLLDLRLFGLSSLLRPTGPYLGEAGGGIVRELDDCTAPYFET